MGSEGVSTHNNDFNNIQSSTLMITSLTELDHRHLILSLRKFIEKWFLLRRDLTDECSDVQEIYYQIKNLINQILNDGLLLKPENHRKLLNELHWLHSDFLRQESSLSSSSTATKIDNLERKKKISEIYSIYEWISDNLKNSLLCSKLQILVSDKELLHNYYRPCAFLNNEIYTNALFICISALELNQSSLLSQIDNCLIITNDKKQLKINKTTIKHRRTSSHPQFSISPKKCSLTQSKSTIIDHKAIEQTQEQEEKKKQNNNEFLNKTKNTLKNTIKNVSNTSSCLEKSSVNRNKICRRFSVFTRKSRSLPDLFEKNLISNNVYRSRSKTVSQPITIPHDGSFVNLRQYDNMKSDFLKITNSESTNSSEIHSSDHPIKTVPVVTMTAATAVESTSSSKTSEISNDLVPIQLVKCDDIKIYFDQSYNNSNCKMQNSNSLNGAGDNNNIPVICYDDSPSSSLGSKGIMNGLSPINLLSCMSGNLFTSSDENLYKDDSSEPYNYNRPCNQNQRNNSIASSTNRYGSFLTSTSTAAASTNDFVGSFIPQQGEKLKISRSYTNNIFDDEFPLETSDFVDYGNYNLQQQQQLQPQQLTSGQSLAAFLQTAQFSRNNTDLERENAHFKISEAIIAILEHMKWAKIEKQLQQNAVDNRNNISNKKSENYSSNSNNKNKNKQFENNESYMKASTSSLTDKDDTDDDEDNEDVHNAEENTIIYKNTNIEENYGSVDDHTAYAEWGETNLDALSAEGVALSLISKFSDSQLPKASDLTWLVSEEDTPQELLPMPESPAANPDDHFIHPFTRGTRDWAPPRQQIIFTDHPPPNRKKQLQAQKYRCAGCGMKVALMYAHRFRYCTYLGKYMCTGCHRNQISTIPAKVLEKWDFSYYPVCVFAYRLLEQMWTYPLFYLPDLNSTLYNKIKNLHTGKLRRIQLKYVQDFIKSCRFANEEQKIFENIPTHLTGDPDKWAMSDFVAVKNGHLQKYIVELIVKAEEHVFNCLLCTAHGFICELCSKDQIVYPWQSKVKRCDNCGSCFHQKCWIKRSTDIDDCVKCQRLKRRQQQHS